MSPSICGYFVLIVTIHPYSWSSLLSTTDPLCSKPTLNYYCLYWSKYLLIGGCIDSICKQPNHAWSYHIMYISALIISCVSQVSINMCTKHCS